MRDTPVNVQDDRRMPARTAAGSADMPSVTPAATVGARLFARPALPGRISPSERAAVHTPGSRWIPTATAAPMYTADTGQNRSAATVFWYASAGLNDGSM